MFSEFSNNALTCIFGNVLNISQGKNIDYIPKLMVLFNVLFWSGTIFCLCTVRIFWPCSLLIFAVDIPKRKHGGGGDESKA